MKRRGRRPAGKFRHEEAPDIARRLRTLVEILEFTHIDGDRVHARRSWGSRADAYARIWEFPEMWQTVLGEPPQYVIEVLSEHFDRLGDEEQTRILIHELLHIPSTFSGAVRNHRGSGECIDDDTVERYYARYRATVDRARPASAQYDLFVSR